MRIHLLQLFNNNFFLKIIYYFKEIFIILLIFFTFLCLSNFYFFNLLTEVDANQGISYLIIFVHLPSAWLMFVFFFINLLFNLFYLQTKYFLYKCLSKTSLFISILNSFLTLITGMVWGSKSWGTFWVWDARLTSSFVFLIILTLTYILFL